MSLKSNAWRNISVRKRMNSSLLVMNASKLRQKGEPSKLLSTSISDHVGYHACFNMNKKIFFLNGFPFAELRICSCV